MYGSGYIFSRTFFRGWVIVSLLWAFFAFFSVTLFPIVEGRHALLELLKIVMRSGGAQKDDRVAEHVLNHHEHRRELEREKGGELLPDSPEALSKKDGLED